MKLPRQCTVLVGGLGTRLGSLTAETPKPLLDCGGRPFLAWLLRELCRFGIEEVILLAGHKPDRIETFSGDVANLLPKPMAIKISVEPAPAGTGGALWHAREMLEENFLLINGDSWLDTNLARFLAGAIAVPNTLGHVLLRSVADASRYGVVDLRGQHITAFYEQSPASIPGTINCGMYVFEKAVFDFITPNCSLEKDVLPVLAAKGVLSGQTLDGYFIDIGIPADYARAQRELPKRLTRPAVFFDRDGVLNEDLGWVGSKVRFRWTDGAKDAVRLVNDVGLHTFLVTNQAGVARGLYAEKDVQDLHRFMAEDLRTHGGTIDDVRYCPFHPNAMVDEYRQESGWRKPAAGMIADLMDKWSVDLAGTFLVGDKETDLQAARAANIAGYKFSGGSLCDFIQRHLLPNRGSVAHGSSFGEVSCA